MVMDGVVLKVDSFDASCVSVASSLTIGQAGIQREHRYADTLRVHSGFSTVLQASPSGVTLQ